VSPGAAGGRGNNIRSVIKGVGALYV
jgi:hypothetical protein